MSPETFSFHLSIQLPISEGYALERTFTLRLAKSEDAKEATRAFFEKRAPVSSGRS